VSTEKVKSASSVSNPPAPANVTLPDVKALSVKVVNLPVEGVTAPIVVLWVT
jgi:hypothetical protein